MSPFPSLNLPIGRRRCLPVTLCPEVVESSWESLWTDGSPARGGHGKGFPRGTWPKGFLDSLGASRGEVGPDQGQ